MGKMKVSKKDLKEAVKEGVSEALSTELPKLRASLSPTVSDEEQKDIEARYEKPSGEEVRSFDMEV